MYIEIYVTFSLFHEYRRKESSSQISYCDKQELRISFLTAPLCERGREELRTWQRSWVTILKLEVCILRFGF